MTTQSVIAKVRGIVRELVDLQTYALKIDLPAGPHPGVPGRARPKASIAQIATWFNDGTRRQPARPFMSVPGRAREAAVFAIIARMRANLRADKTLGTLPSLQIGAAAMRDVWMQRLQLNGDDRAFAPLSPRYFAWKARKGLDLRTGIATGAMLRAFQSARLTIVRNR